MKGERMNRRRLRTGLLAGAVALSLIAAACGDDDDSSSGGGGNTPVKLQLQWVYQSQFAGYLAALDQGYFKEEGLDVTLLEGAVDIVPQTVLAQGNADFAIAWVPKALQSREQGAAITDIGQIFQRSGTLQVSKADKPVPDPAALKGKNVGNWGFGNEYELFAGMTKAGLNPGSDVKLVQQDFNMNAFLAGDIDAAQAMIYNEYAQVLEAKNPTTGKLFTPDDLTVINWNDVGTAMLQDAIWADTNKLQNDKTYQDNAVKLLKASIRGWVYCRDNPEKCRDIVVAKGSKLGASHQLWQMNEINKLIWPSPGGIGVIQQADWDRTVDIALTTKNAEGKTVLSKKPEGLAYSNDYVNKAIAELKDVDTKGEGFKPIEVTLNEGGS